MFKVGYLVFLFFGLFILGTGCDNPESEDSFVPKIISRSAWCPGNEIGESTENLYNIPLRQALNTIVVHHTADTTDSPLLIFRYHTLNRKYTDIGYHYLITSNGTIYEGRPINRRGAHLANQNSGAIGIALFGNFDKTDPTNAQLRSLNMLTGWLKRQFDIRQIGGHSDFPGAKTCCPGHYLRPYIKTLSDAWQIKYVKK